jgi:hypothetical protein
LLLAACTYTYAYSLPLSRCSVDGICPVLPFLVEPCAHLCASNPHSCSYSYPYPIYPSGRLRGMRIRAEFLCPITYDLLTDPVIAADGNTYERTAIEKWLSKTQSSPLNGEALEVRLLRWGGVSCSACVISAICASRVCCMRHLCAVCDCISTLTLPLPCTAHHAFTQSGAEEDHPGVSCGLCSPLPLPSSSPPPPEY